MTNNNIEQYVMYLKERNEEGGLFVNEFQVYMALSINEFKQALEESAREGWLIEKILRVYYSQNCQVLEVLARLSKGQGISQQNKSILLTMTADLFQFVSLAKDFNEPEDLKPEDQTFVPLVMALPTITAQFDMPIDEPHYQTVCNRRDRYIFELDREIYKKNPMTPTNCQSCSQTTCNTPRTCRVSSTPPRSNPDMDDRDCSTFDSCQECNTDRNDDNN